MANWKLVDPSLIPPNVRLYVAPNQALQQRERNIASTDGTFGSFPRHLDIALHSPPSTLDAVRPAICYDRNTREIRMRGA